jgi:hypothetical protein
MDMDNIPILSAKKLPVIPEDQALGLMDSQAPDVRRSRSRSRSRSGSTSRARGKTRDASAKGTPAVLAVETLDVNCGLDARDVAVLTTSDGTLALPGDRGGKGQGKGPELNGTNLDLADRIERERSRIGSLARAKALADRIERERNLALPDNRPPHRRPRPEDHPQTHYIDHLLRGIFPGGLELVSDSEDERDPLP